MLAETAGAGVEFGVDPIASDAMVLVCGFYLDPDPRRQAELLECVRRNSLNPHIAQVHVLLECALDASQARTRHPALAHPKVHPVPFGRRLRYSDILGYANARLPGRRIIVANADIHFDATLARLDGQPLEGKFLCLSRWDIDTDGLPQLFEHERSQDAWIFSTPLRAFPCDFPLGVPGCDNRLAFEAARAGLVLGNPARSVRALHLHASGVRRYHGRDRLPGPTLAVPPAPLGTRWVCFIVFVPVWRADMAARLAALSLAPGSICLLVIPAHASDVADKVRAACPHALVHARAHAGAAEALNRAVSELDDDALLCFIDADTPASSRPAGLLVSTLLAWPCADAWLQVDGPRHDMLACGKALFQRVGGFDEVLAHLQDAMADLAATLRWHQAPRGPWHEDGSAQQPAHTVAALPRPSPASQARPGDVDGEDLHRAIDRRYRRIKSLLRPPPGEAPMAPSTMHDIHFALTRRAVAASGRPLPWAAVAFTEAMGYGLATLQPGESTHINEHHAIGSLPESLRGLRFTQVVAHRASPVVIRLCTGGRLLLLVDVTWDGSRDAQAWLRGIGQREPGSVDTVDGIRFHVWSVAGAAAQVLHSPTQVMLATDMLMKE